MAKNYQMYGSEMPFEIRKRKVLRVLVIAVHLREIIDIEWG